MSKIELSDFLKSDCELGNPFPAMLIEIYKRFGGDPCCGCGYAPNCKVKLALEADSKARQRGDKCRIVQESNTDIAKRLGISKRQVSKLRKRGELKY